MSDAQIPGKDDMVDVVYWAGRCAELTTQLADAQDALRAAWSKVPADMEILRSPYRADISVHCHICGRSTHWRTGKGLAQCKNDCSVKVSSRVAGRGNVSEEAWDLINALFNPSTDESLDDD